MVHWSDQDADGISEGHNIQVDSLLKLISFNGIARLWNVIAPLFASD
jgi:hypothetical protein